MQGLLGTQSLDASLCSPIGLAVTPPRLRALDREARPIIQRSALLSQVGQPSRRLTERCIKKVTLDRRAAGTEAHSTGRIQGHFSGAGVSARLPEAHPTWRIQGHFSGAGVSARLPEACPTGRIQRHFSGAGVSARLPDSRLVSEEELDFGPFLAARDRRHALREGLRQRQSPRLPTHAERKPQTDLDAANRWRG